MGDSTGGGLALHVEVRWGCSTVAIVHRAVPASFVVGVAPGAGVDCVVPAEYLEGQRLSVVSAGADGSAAVTADEGPIELPVGEERCVQLGGPDGVCIAVEIVQALPRARRWRPVSRGAIAAVVASAALHAAWLAVSRGAEAPTADEREHSQMYAIHAALLRIDDRAAEEQDEEPSLEPGESVQDCERRCEDRMGCRCQTWTPPRYYRNLRWYESQVREPPNPLLCFGLDWTACSPFAFVGETFPLHHDPGERARIASICGSPYAPQTSVWHVGLDEYFDLEAMSADDIARASVGDREGPGAWLPAAQASLDGSARVVRLDWHRRTVWSPATHALARSIRARTGALRLCSWRVTTTAETAIVVRLSADASGRTSQAPDVSGRAPAVLTDCVTAALRSLETSASRGAIEVTVRFVQPDEEQPRAR